MSDQERNKASVYKACKPSGTVSVCVCLCVCLSVYPGGEFDLLTVIMWYAALFFDPLVTINTADAW